MADPTQLQNQIFQTFGQGVTGIDYGTIAEGMRRDRTRKREKLESLYDVGAELDASAYSALQSEMSGILDKIESNELIAGRPDFQAAQSRLASIAADLKTTQDLSKGVFEAATKNPEGVSYITTDENGNKVDLGYQGLVNAMQGFATGNYDNPEGYIGAGSTFLESVGERVDENAVRKNTEDLVDGIIKRKLDEIGADDIKIQQAYSRGATNLIQVYKDLVGDDEGAMDALRAEINTAAKNTLGRQLGQVAAQRRRDDKTIGDDDAFISSYVEPFIQTGQGDLQRGRNFAPNRPSDSTNMFIRKMGNGWGNDGFIFDVISDNEVRVNSRGKTEPTKVWGGYDELGSTDGQQGEKKSLTSVVFKDGRFFAKLVGENLLEPSLVPFDQNRRLLQDFYGITEESVRTMLGMDDNSQDVETDDFSEFKRN